MTQTIPVLLYHSVSTQVSSAFRPYSIAPEGFAAHMAYLRDQQFNPITVGALAAAMRGEVSLPDAPVVISFDDGLLDFYEGALPILQQFGFPATLYVVAGAVGETSHWLGDLGEGERPMLSWEQIAELPAYGIELGAHSMNHPQLDTVPRPIAQIEIAESRRVMEQRLNMPILSFAYPHGYHGQAVRDMVEAAGYESACGVKNQIANLDGDLYSIARLTVLCDDDVTRIAGWLAGGDTPVDSGSEKFATKGWRWYRRVRKVLD
jgi:peptidoglycan/xylan/chitin deacetylase (PgdA/CDA1 family)